MTTVEIPSDPSAPLTSTPFPASRPAARGDNELVLATRKSPLARIQTAHISKALIAAHPQLTTRTVAIDTIGDKDKTTPLPSFNAKALWTTELEALLASGEADVVVHCLKDMPTQLPEGLVIGAITEREDPRDAVCIAPHLLERGVRTIAQLPEGSTVGTSSLRRSSQLKRKYPTLKFADCRGNVGTRLAKLDAPGGEYAALILAAAGLKRMGWEARIAQYLSHAEGGMLWAVGQGALCLQIREGDDRVMRLLAGIVDEKTFRAGLAERSLLRTLEGGCSVPIGVETEWLRAGQSLGVAGGDSIGLGAKPAAEYDRSGKAVEKSDANGQDGGSDDDRTDELLFRGVVVSLDGKRAAEAEIRRVVKSREDADQLGRDLAQRLIEHGATGILEEITLNRKIIQEQGEA